MKGGGGDGKDKGKDDRHSRADEAVCWYGMGRGMGRDSFCVSHARAVASVLSPLGGDTVGAVTRTPLAQADSGEEEVGWGWRGGRF